MQKEVFWNIDLYYLNANYYINKPNEIITDIKKYNPKYIAIVELNPNLYSEIKNNLNFKNDIYLNKWVNSFWFFSNEELLNSKTHNLTYPIWEIKTSEAVIFLIHPLPWLNSTLFKSQKKNFWEIKKLYDENKNDKKIILWDFNSSFYSQTFKKHFWDMHYKPIYSWNIKWILRLPIDYAIWNKKFYTTNRSNLETSDHTPLLINFE